MAIIIPTGHPATDQPHEGPWNRGTVTTDLLICVDRFLKFGLGFSNRRAHGKMACAVEFFSHFTAFASGIEADCSEIKVLTPLLRRGPPPKSLHDFYRIVLFLLHEIRWNLTTPQLLLPCSCVSLLLRRVLLT